MKRPIRREMSLMKQFCLALMAVCALNAMACAQDSETQTLTTLEKILRNPEAYRSMKATFVVQFHQVGNVDNPVYTKFDRNWFQSFAAWPDSAPVWERAKYKDSYPYFFLPRISEGTKSVVAAPTFTRFLVTGVVDEIFDGKPYIEVKALEVLENSLTTDTVRSIAQGYRLRDTGLYAQSAKSFRAADSDKLPLAVRSLVVREEAWSLHQSGETLAGMNRLRDSLKWLGRDPLVAKALTAARTGLQLDENYQPVVTTELVDVQVGNTPVQGEVRVESNPHVTQPAPVQQGNGSGN